MPPAVHKESTSSLGADGHFLSPAARKKNSSSLWLIVLLIVFAGMGLVRLFSTSKEATPRVKVVAAAVDIPAGTRLGYSNLRYMELPRAYWSPQMVSSTHLLAGRCARQYLMMAEPVLSSQVLPGKESIASQLAVNERAVALKLTEESMVEHALEPGDLVDVIYTASLKGVKCSKLICQRARVLLAASRRADGLRRSRAGDATLVTLALSKGEAEMVAHAAESGKLKLVLRNPQDSQELTPEVIADANIFPAAFNEPKNDVVLPPPPPVAAPAPDIEDTDGVPASKSWSLDMYSGSHKETISVPLSGN